MGNVGVTRRGLLTASAALVGAGLAGATTLAFGQQPPLPAHERSDPRPRHFYRLRPGGIECLGIRPGSVVGLLGGGAAIGRTAIGGPR